MDLNLIIKQIDLLVMSQKEANYPGIATSISQNLLFMSKRKQPCISIQSIVGTEKHGLALYPSSHFVEDLAQNLLPQMPDKV